MNIFCSYIQGGIFKSKIKEILIISHCGVVSYQILLQLACPQIKGGNHNPLLGIFEICLDTNARFLYGYVTITLCKYNFTLIRHLITTFMLTGYIKICFIKTF